jgi:hypothetical protein
VWNNLPQPVETESEEDHQPQPQAQQQEQQQEQEQLQQQKSAHPLQQQDDDSLDTSVRSKSPISEGSLVGIETAPGYGAVTSKIPSDSPDGPLPDMESKAALTVKKVKFDVLNVFCRLQWLIALLENMSDVYAFGIQSFKRKILIQKCNSLLTYHI